MSSRTRGRRPLRSSPPTGGEDRRRKAGFLFGAGLGGLLALALFAFSAAHAAPPDPNRGKLKYRQLCVGCHGARGRGDGPAAASLDPKPRNYTDKRFIRTVTDEAMAEIIKKGGAAVKKSPVMPAWGGVLSDAEIRDVIAYIHVLMRSPEK